MSFDDFQDSLEIKIEIVEVFDKHEASTSQMLYALSEMLILTCVKIKLPKEVFVATVSKHFSQILDEVEKYEKEGKLK